MAILINLFIKISMNLNKKSSLLLLMDLQAVSYSHICFAAESNQPLREVLENR